MSVPGILEEIQKSDREDCDAYIIACYGDPGLHAARELTAKQVIGIAKASLYMGAMLYTRFSIVTVIPRTRTMREEMVGGYGFRDKVVSIRSSPLYVLDIEKDPDGALNKLRIEARAARDKDDAEAILLGCAGFTQFVQNPEQELEIPVLDGVVCGVKLAESLVELGKATSKYKTYRPPERKTFCGIFERFGSKQPLDQFNTSESTALGRQYRVL